MNPFLFLFPFLFFAHESVSQQTYSRNHILECNNSNTTEQTPEFLYTCNGIQSCSTFLIFRTQPLYNTVFTISNLMSTDPTNVARINRITDSAENLPLNKELIIPITCSCSGQYYQANTSFVIPINTNYFTIANFTFQGLTTCDSLQKNNIYKGNDLQVGGKIRVPLRCACPTVNQTMSGIRFLLTYLITWEDSIKKISKRFDVKFQDLVLENGFSSVEDLIFPFTTLLVPLSTEPLSSQTRTPGRNRNLNQNPKLSKKGIIIGTISGGFLAILSGVFVICLVSKRKRANKSKTVKWELPKDIQLGIASVDHVLKIYKFEELEEATDGFTLEKRLSASVYKGSIKGRKVAIKQMGTHANKEVKILQKTNHFNLIGLYGVCEHDKSCYLVYEFMENGSLNEWLRDLTCQESQTWNNRIRIALDVAKGLQYIHNFANPTYVHKDINTSNILLTKDLRAKISKFGLAKSTEKGENVNSSIKCRSESKGYLAPEYLEAGFVTTKTDVYAFGVVLLELITGKKAVYENDDDGGQVMLCEEVVSIMDDGHNAKSMVNYIIDPRLKGRHAFGFVIEEDELAMRLVKLSIGCLESEPLKRLSMNEIVSTLMIIHMDAQSSDTMFLV